MQADPALLWLCCLNDPTYFSEPYPIEDHTYEVILQEAAQTTHEIIHDGIWLQAKLRTSDHNFPGQGWKIHLSITEDGMPAALKLVAEAASQLGIPFKTILGPRTLRLTRSSLWMRSQSGKAIVIYPRTDQQFVELAQTLQASLAHLPAGPRILSDRPIATGDLVQFRYGSFEKREVIEPDGSSTYVMHAPSGDTPDERQPWYSVPAWVTPPMEAAVPPALVPGPLRIGPNERFRVVSAIKFTNAGGVYNAIDELTGGEVVIKEARPAVLDASLTRSAIQTLQHEAEILEQANQASCGPRLLDLFVEDGHSFLATLRIPHDSHLGTFTTVNNPLYSKSVGSAYHEKYRRYLRLVADRLLALHEVGIAFGDLSFTNVLVGPDVCELVDFGSAFRPAQEPPSPVMTAGLGWQTSADSFDRDVRSLGYLICGGYILPAGLSEFSRRAPLEAAHYVARELGWDESLVDLAERCVAATPEMAESVLRDAAQSLADQRGEPGHSRSISPPARKQKASVRPPDWHGLLAGVVDSANPDREADLYRASPLVFIRHPCALAWGAGGVLLTLLDSEVPIPADHHDWWRKWVLTKPAAPGLLVGAAGFSIIAGRLGDTDTLNRTLRDACAAAASIADLSYGQGLSGIGLACLEAWKSTGCTNWADQAMSLYEQVQLRWSEMLLTPGLVAGDSGVLVFAANMFESFPNVISDQFGRAVLHSAIGKLEPTPGGYLSVLQQDADRGYGVFRHYLSDGTAGVLSAVCRWIGAGGAGADLTDCRLMVSDCERLLTATAGLLTGYAGLLSSLLDLYAVSREGSLLDRLRELAVGLNIFVRPSNSGLLLAGEQNIRAASDLASGAAGVISVLRRLEDPSRPNILPGLQTTPEAVPV